MSLRPEILSARAAHQYRRRDILAYVSLRLYLRSRCAVRDAWSRDIAVQQVLDRAAPGYHRVLAFKERGKDGVVAFRTLHIPGPTEMMAEAALLDACAEAGGPFTPAPSVFSYVLSKGMDNDGIFRPYFPYFVKRHEAIANACRRYPNAKVIYTDIRRYYPSIRLVTAEAAWEKACRAVTLPERFSQVGRKLLAGYQYQDPDFPSSLLTGPMFCHVIANLTLSDLDSEMNAIAPGRYFRYVDDIVLIELSDDDASLEQRLSARLSELGLQPNEGKRLEVKSSDWLRGADDYSDASGPDSWPAFVGGIKQLLLRDPEQRAALADALQENELRIVPLDYSEVAQERDYLVRVRQLMHGYWFRRKMRQLDVCDIVQRGLRLRATYSAMFQRTVERFMGMSGYDRKRHLHRLRFLLSRLLYVASQHELASIAASLDGIPELALARIVFRAIASRDVSELVAYGASAAQAAAQPLKAIGCPVVCRPATWQEEPVIQAVGILRLNGVPLSPIDVPRTPLMKFCDWADDSDSLLTSDNPYMKEIGAMHGKGGADLNTGVLGTAFDRDEEMVFDMQDVLEGSS